MWEDTLSQVAFDYRIYEYKLPEYHHPKFIHQIGKLSADPESLIKMIDSLLDALKTG